MTGFVWGPMSDQQLREKAEGCLRNAFGYLSQHTHGDQVQGDLLALAQSNIAQALVRIDNLNSREG